MSLSDAVRRRRHAVLREGGGGGGGGRRAAVRRRGGRVPAAVRQRAQRPLRHHDVPGARRGRAAGRALLRARRARRLRRHITRHAHTKPLLPIQFNSDYLLTVVSCLHHKTNQLFTLKS